MKAYDLIKTYDLIKAYELALFYKLVSPCDLVFFMKNLRKL